MSKIRDSIYCCTECPSSIEIFFINDNNNFIEFKCLNQYNSHKYQIRKTMSIEEYLEKMEKYKQKKINEDICEIHKKRNKYIGYCFDCNYHLCQDCLKTRNHINHYKNSIIEIKPMEEELNIIKDVIEDYKSKVINLKDEILIKNKELEDSLNNNISMEKNVFESKILNNEKNKEKELKLNKDIYLNNLKEIKRVCGEEVKIIRNNYEKKVADIENKYKLINEKAHINHNYKIEELKTKYNQEIQKLDNGEEIQKLNNKLKINEIIYNSYNTCNNNYFNAKNIINIACGYYKNEYFRNNIFKKIYKNTNEKALRKIICQRSLDINLSYSKEKEINQRRNEKKELDSKIKDIIEEYDEEIKILKEENEKLKKECENKLIQYKEEYEQKIKELKEENENKLKVYEEYKNEIEEKIKEKNSEMKIIYKINENEDSVKLFGLDFIDNNKTICKIVHEGKEYELKETFDIKDKKDKDVLEIKLKGSLNHMNYMFYKCTSLLSLPDISKLRTNNITNMSCMFNGCSSLISLPDISEWNTTNVTSMNCMFKGCSSLISLPDISKWNVSNVINMYCMFNGCSSLQSLPDISLWNTSNVINMSNMFNGCSSLLFLPDISKWDTTNIKNFEYMFNGCSSLLSLPDISNFNPKNINNLSNIFCGCSSLSRLPDISKWDTSSVTSMTCLFKGCSSLSLIPDISNWSTDNVTIMYSMFNGCSSLSHLPDISKWNTSKVKSISSMFNGCPTILNIPPKFIK